MDTGNSTVARRVAEAAAAFQTQRTGHAPGAVTVVLGQDTLVVTPHDALTPAERVLAGTPAGAAKVREFHRELFAASAAPLLEEIGRITGVAVREAAAEVEPSTGGVIQVFTTGTVVQVFTLTSRVPADSWAGG